MQSQSPAQLYATLAGAFLAILGVVGFFYEASFDTGEELRSGEVLGVIAVNGWHNLLHLAMGLALLGAAASGTARTYALGFGLLFVVIAVWGFAADEAILSALAVNTGANLLHLALGLVGLGAGAATPPEREPRARVRT